VHPEQSSPAEGAASFHTTHWTIVIRAAQSQAQGRPAALAELCRLYWNPLYDCARRRGHSPDDAQLGDGSPSYAEAATALGIGLGGVKTLVHRLRKRYGSILREEIARTVSGPAEIEDEIHALCEALLASGGRLAP
jgi:hypothetical protein